MGHTYAACELQVLLLSGPELESAIAERAPRNRASAWLQSPKDIRYFVRRPALAPDQDRRVLLLCVQPLVGAAGAGGHDGPTHEIVGILELQTAPYDSCDMWLKYISVATAHENRGVAKQLLRRMAQYVCSENRSRRAADRGPLRLHRSMSTPEGELKIRRFIDQLLDGHGIAWTQPAAHGDVRDRAAARRSI